MLPPHLVQHSLNAKLNSAVAVANVIFSTTAALARVANGRWLMHSAVEAAPAAQVLTIP